MKYTVLAFTIYMTVLLVLRLRYISTGLIEKDTILANLIMVPVLIALTVYLFS